MTHQLQPKFYENGQKRHERKYTEDGQKESDHYYYEDGQKESVYYYKDGKETYWHRNGQKKSEAIWKNRDRDGKKTVWNENGQKLYERNYKNGNLIDETKYKYFKNGQIALKENYKNGNPDGNWYHYVQEDKNLNPEKRDGAFRYWKFVVNAGVRYGEILDAENIGIAKLEFSSVFVESQPASNKKTRELFEGVVKINNRKFDKTRSVFEGKKLITFFPISDNAERYKNKLGGLVDFYMNSESKTITKERLASFYHECYQKNPIVTAAELIVMDLKDREYKKQEKLYETIEIEVRDRLLDKIRNELLLEIQQIDTDDAKEMTEELRAIITFILAERKDEKKDKENQKIKGKDVNVVNDSIILVNVDRVEHGRFNNLCIRLTFDDDTHKYLKIETWDQDGTIESKAKALIGKEVRTTCWDPVGTTKWSDMDYFNNIFQV